MTMDTENELQYQLSKHQISEQLKKENSQILNLSHNYNSTLH